MEPLVALGPPPSYEGPSTYAQRALPEQEEARLPGPTPAVQPETVNPSLVGGMVAEWFDNYILRAADTVIVDGTRVGMASAAQQFQVQGAVYSAYLDEKCCPECEALDETQVAVPSDEYAALTPPHHGHCRCLWIYVEEGEEDFVPDEDALGGLRDIEGGPGMALRFDLNPDLQEAFAADIEKARNEIFARKMERLAVVLDRKAAEMAAEANMTPEEREARDRRREAAQRGAETRARRQAKKGASTRSWRSPRRSIPSS